MELVKERDLPYGTTQVDEETSEIEIGRLLRKYNINNKQVTEYEGKKFIKFVYKNKPYLIDLPEIKCLKYNGSRWVPGIANKKIAMRMILNFLKSILINSTFIEIDQMLLGYRMIKVDNQITTVGKAIDSNENLLLGNGEIF